MNALFYVKIYRNKYESGFHSGLKVPTSQGKSKKVIIKNGRIFWLINIHILEKIICFVSRNCRTGLKTVYCTKSPELAHAWSAFERTFTSAKSRKSAKLLNSRALEPAPPLGLCGLSKVTTVEITLSLDSRKEGTATTSGVKYRNYRDTLPWAQPGRASLPRRDPTRPRPPPPRHSATPLHRTADRCKLVHRNSPFPDKKALWHTGPFSAKRCRHCVLGSMFPQLKWSIWVDVQYTSLAVPAFLGES